MWKKAYEALKAAGLAVYAPGQKPGKCTSPYAVVYDGGQAAARAKRAVRGYLTVLVCVPREKYSLLADTRKRVSAAMRGAGLTPTGEQGAARLEEGAEAISQTMEYSRLKKNCG